MPEVPLTPDERRVEFLRAQLFLSLQAMRSKLHQAVDSFVRDAGGFLNNPLRAILDQSNMTPAEAGAIWRDQVVQAKAQLMEQLEEQFRRVRQPSADLLMLLGDMQEILPAPLPEDHPDMQAIFRRVKQGTTPQPEEAGPHPF